jgi:phenylalanyl-tRNA synthetase beta chain
VDPQIQSRLDPQTAAIALDNPIAETLAVMRSQLWAGLIPVWRHNLQRQARRVRLFEAGVCFERRDGQIVETQRIGGLAAGPALPEQWGAAARPTDFYDIKADVEALLGPAGAQYRFEPAAHPALHPGQTARLSRDGRHAGWIGALHPAVVQALDLPEAPLLFELDWASIAEQALPRPTPPAEFPHSRRDLAVVVAETVPAQRILDVVQAAGGKLLNQVFVFDIYRGKGLKNGCKSVAIGLIFKDYSRTLEQQEVDESVAVVVAALAQHLEAAIRT